MRLDLAVRPLPASAGMSATLRHDLRYDLEVVAAEMARRLGEPEPFKVDVLSGVIAVPLDAALRLLNVGRIA